MAGPSYIVAIDLGTTNCTMAYSRLGCDDKSSLKIETFLIPQLTKAGLCEELPFLPSFVYFALDEELTKGAAVLPWSDEQSFCVGLWAKERGAELPLRSVSSAKSWLSHAGVDRRERFLPLGAEESQQKMSPLDVSAALLAHMRQAWDHKMGDLAPFGEQQLLITVPASFDPAARQLVQEAAHMAGCGDAILLEEPLAAFYAWLHANPEAWRKALPLGATALVVDIGGGTSDFSTITAVEHEGELHLERRSVGSHLLLGGDNIDLLCAYLAKDKFEEQGKSLDDQQWRALQHACRGCKEELLGLQPLKSCDVAVMGRGRKLIGGTMKVQIEAKEFLNAILEGFFPIVDAKDQSLPEQRTALQQLGLPFAQDARITAQLAKFLSQTGEGGVGGVERFVLPDVVLFNGGTMRAEPLRKRLLEQLRLWRLELKGQEGDVTELVEGVDYDRAVSRGAVYYALARSGHGIRVKASCARSYFVGVEETAPAVPGRQARLTAHCIVPYGMEEGSEAALKDQHFALIVGEPVTFRFFSHGTELLSDETKPAIGTIVRNWQSELTELHPIEASMDRDGVDGKVVRVQLYSRLTELGVLELRCEAADGRSWKLEFDAR